MKKWLNKQTLAVFMIAAFLFTGVTVFADTQSIQAFYNSIRVRVNGVFIETDVEPCIINGRTMVPARFVAEPLGATVSFNETDNSVDIEGGNVINFSNGDKYIGEIKNGVPYGKGTISYTDGAFYAGDFVEGLKQGTGYGTDPDGDTYFGEWVSGSEQGNGYLTFVNGERYYVEMDKGAIKNSLAITNPTIPPVTDPVVPPTEPTTPPADTSGYQVYYNALTAQYNIAIKALEDAANVKKKEAQDQYTKDYLALMEQKRQNPIMDGSSAAYDAEERNIRLYCQNKINAIESELSSNKSLIKSKYDADVAALKAKYGM